MARPTPRTSLAGLFIATTALALLIGCWTNYPRGEWNIVATAAAASFVGSLLTPLGMKCGVVVGAVCVFVSCLIVEKDPSGLGPFEIIFPIQMIVSTIPIIATAWAGHFLRAQLTGRQKGISPNIDG